MVLPGFDEVGVGGEYGFVTGLGTGVCSKSLILALALTLAIAGAQVLALGLLGAKKLWWGRLLRPEWMALPWVEWKSLRAVKNEQGCSARNWVMGALFGSGI